MKESMEMLSASRTRWQQVLPGTKRRQQMLPEENCRLLNRIVLVRFPSLYEYLSALAGTRFLDFDFLDLKLNFFLLIFSFAEPTPPAEGATAEAAEEAVKNATGEAERATAEAAKKATEAAGSTSAPETAAAGGDAEMGATDDAMPAADDHPAAPEAPPAGKFFRLSSPRRETDAPGTSGAGEHTLKEVDDELIIPPTRTTEEERDADDDTADHLFLQFMENGFNEMRQRYSRRCEKLQRRANYVKMAEQELLQRVDEAQVWHAEKLADLKSREAVLAAAKEAFILEKAAADMAQVEAAKKAEQIDGELVQRKIQLDSHEEDLAARETALADTLRAKDEEIQSLLAKRTEELKQGAEVKLFKLCLRSMPGS